MCVCVPNNGCGLGGRGLLKIEEMEVGRWGGEGLGG